MRQQWTLRNKQFNNHNKQDKNNQKYNVYFMCVCMYVENTAMASWIKIWFVHPCVHVCMLGKVDWVNESLGGRSKEDKKLTLLTYICMHVCIYVKDCKYRPFVFLSSTHTFFMIFGDNVSHSMCRIPCVAKERRMLLHCVLCSMPSAIHPCL